MDDPSVQAEENPSPAKKKRGGQASIRMEKLGDDPRLHRSIIRESLAPGYYVVPGREEEDQNAAQTRTVLCSPGG